jgi:hypothetical protein
MRITIIHRTTHELTTIVDGEFDEWSFRDLHNWYPLNIYQWIYE